MDDVREDKPDCRPLTPGEIRKLKRNGIDPHSLKPKEHGSRFDLYRCKGSGQVYVVRKAYIDKDGNIHFPKDPYYDDTGIDIDTLLIAMGMLWASMDDSPDVIIEFRIMRFKRPTEQVEADLERIGLEVHEQWSAGQAREGTRLSHKENGVSIGIAGSEGDFEELVSRLVSTLHENRAKITDICGPHYAELSCVLYMPGTIRPSLSFSRDVLARLADLGADVDIDLYVTE